MIDKAHYKTIIFNHVFKSGGQNVGEILRHHFPEDAILQLGLYPSKQRVQEQRVRNLPDERKAALRLVLGHNPYGVDQCLPHPCVYFAFLRDPFNQFVSAYYFWFRHVPKDPPMEAFMKNPPSLEEYVKQGEIYWGFNPLIKMFMSLWHRDQPTLREGKDIVITDEIYNQALAMAETDYAFVGVTERFDESIALMNHVFGWKGARYFKENVATNYDRRTIDPRLRELHNSLNPYDLKFYKAMTEKFERTIQFIPDFDKLVAETRQDTAAYQRSPRRALSFAFKSRVGALREYYHLYRWRKSQA